MRLHRLEVAGFGPFRERQLVDFDGYADDGIFLIAGRTGAGKSSILDAVCYGLYGGVPRYETGEKRLRSDHAAPADESVVVVEFSTSAGRFRVTRSPEYTTLAKNGRERISKATAVLEERVGEVWQGRAAKPRDVGHELTEILQLNQQQFLQVILLAQNRFARFLLADSRERRDLLRKLFRTERFEDLQERFENRRRLSEQALSGRHAALAARLEDAEQLVAAEEEESEEEIPASTGERLVVLRAAQGRAAERAGQRAEQQRDAAQRMDAADRAAEVARERRKLQDQRDAAQQELRSVEAAEASIVDASRVLAQARAAEVLRAPLDAAVKAQAEQTAAAVTLETARRRWDALGIDLSDASPEGLRVWTAEQMRQSGSWQRAADLEAQSPQRAAERASAENDVVSAESRLTEIEKDRAALPERLRALTEERDAARRIADSAPAKEQDRERAQRRRLAAAEVLRLAAAHQAAEERLAETSVAYAAAQQHYADLQQRRLGGYAGELASGLVAGSPCPVCGAAEHPAPAAHADPISQDDIDRAQAQRDAAAEEEKRANAALTSIREERAAQVSRAEGRSLPDAEEEERQTATAHEEAVAAVALAAKLEEQLEEASARSAQIEQERQAAEAVRAQLRERAAALLRRDDDAEKEILLARGAFDSVAARIAEVTAQIAAGNAFADAAAEHSRREQVLTEAERDRESGLADSPFRTAEEATSALRTVAAQTALEEQITTHRADLERVRTVLSQLAEQELPEELIDLAPLTHAADQARAAWQIAVEQAATARTSAERLAALIASADEEHEQSAAASEAHNMLRDLADAIAGRGSNTHRMTLETFVLAAELEDIVEAANRRLQEMSTGRYQLRYSDALAARGAASGLGIVVSDAFTGQARPAQSLSGGETFLASLALALGLSEVVTSRAGGIQLDTLFIDEGFGSLDADTLDIAMRTLDELRQGGRTVGVISHVEAMQEQISAQLRVVATPEGPSVIRS